MSDDQFISKQVAMQLANDLQISSEGYHLYNQAINNYCAEIGSMKEAIVRCKDCKHNPKDTWFECPMSHLSEKQRPETAWCWKGERRTDENNY